MGWAGAVCLLCHSGEAWKPGTVTGGVDGSWYLEGLVFVWKRNSVGGVPLIALLIGVAHPGSMSAQTPGADSHGGAVS